MTFLKNNPGTVAAFAAVAVLIIGRRGRSACRQKGAISSRM